MFDLRLPKGILRNFTEFAQELRKCLDYTSIYIIKLPNSDHDMEYVMEP